MDYTIILVFSYLIHVTISTQTQRGAKGAFNCIGIATNRVNIPENYGFHIFSLLLCYISYLTPSHAPTYGIRGVLKCVESVTFRIINILKYHHFPSIPKSSDFHPATTHRDAKGAFKRQQKCHY